jgi:hypothetical protein
MSIEVYEQQRTVSLELGHGVSRTIEDKRRQCNNLRYDLTGDM